MFVECAWCKKNMGEREPFDNKNTSHGICPACFDMTALEMASYTVSPDAAPLLTLVQPVPGHPETEFGADQPHDGAEVISSAVDASVVQG